MNKDFNKKKKKLQHPKIATTPMLLTLLLGLLQLNYRHQNPNQKRRNLCTQSLENLFQDPQEDPGKKNCLFF